MGFVFSLVNDQGFWGPRNGALKGGGRDYGRMGNAFRSCRKAYSPGINLAGKAIAKGSDRPIAIGLQMRKVADHGSGKGEFWGEIFARFAVRESGSKREEGKEPSRQTTHNETR